MKANFMLIDSNIKKKEFCYVDGYYKNSSGKATLWRRIKISEVDSQIRKRASNFNCFTTPQHFCSPIKTEDELIFSNLYFDFDKTERYPFPRVQTDVNDLLDFFHRKLELHKKEARVWFSGSKGMHVYVDAISLGIEPLAKLSHVFKSIASYLKICLSLKTLDISGIYSVRHQMRLSDSVHPISKLFKVELYPSEIMLPEEKIREIAREPRGSLYSTEKIKDLSMNNKANTFYNQFI